MLTPRCRWPLILPLCPLLLASAGCTRPTAKATPNAFSARTKPVSEAPSAAGRLAPATGEVEHPTRPKSFRLTLRLEKFPDGREVLLWQSPDRWLDTLELRGPRDPITAGCNEAEAWRCISGDGKHLCERWDLKALTQVAENARVRRDLWMANSGSVICPVNPWSAYWKDKFASPLFRRDLKLLGEEQVDSTLTLKYESTPYKTFHYWFGKEDGILRRTVMFDKHGREYDRETTTKLELDVETKDSDFASEVPPETTIRDRTAEALEGLKRASN